MGARQAHYPCALPEDFKSFLRLSDGLLLKWSIRQDGAAPCSRCAPDAGLTHGAHGAGARLAEATQPLGCMQVNDIANLTTFPRATFAKESGARFESAGGPRPAAAAQGTAAAAALAADSAECMAAFELDSTALDGRLALLYRGGHTKPQVYFQDLSETWFFIASTFTDYFRLMMMHLGVPRWQVIPPTLAGCFLALGSGLGLVGTASSRR